jgi:hypothetical protein
MSASRKAASLTCVEGRVKSCGRGVRWTTEMVERTGFSYSAEVPNLDEAQARIEE